MHERGVGETPSCGTGACAAVAAALHHGPRPGVPSRYAVDAPGGRLFVDITAEGAMTLTGPASLTAQGTIRLNTPWPPAPVPGQRGLHRPATELRHPHCRPGPTGDSTASWPPRPGPDTTSKRTDER